MLEPGREEPFQGGIFTHEAGRVGIKPSQEYDDDLAVKAQSGNLDALGEIYDRHYLGIFRFILVRVYHQPLAEDLAGDVFLRVVQGLPGYKLVGVPFRAWLFRITRNLLVDHFRAERRYRASDIRQADEDSPGIGDPALIVEQRLTLERVQSALARLDPTESDVIVLRFLVGLSTKEVAQTLNKSIGAVKALQHRGLTNLRLMLVED